MLISFDIPSYIIYLVICSITSIYLYSQYIIYKYVKEQKNKKSGWDYVWNSITSSGMWVSYFDMGYKLIKYIYMIKKFDKMAIDKIDRKCSSNHIEESNGTCSTKSYETDNSLIQSIFSLLDMPNVDVDYIKKINMKLEKFTSDIDNRLDTILLKHKESVDISNDTTKVIFDKLNSIDNAIKEITRTVYADFYKMKDESESS